MIDYCIEQARKIPVVKGRQRVYAVITDKKGKVLSESMNLYSKSHPEQKRLSMAVGLSEERAYLHAEVACIIKASKRLRKGLTGMLYVARVGYSGKPLDACPCVSCRLAIQECEWLSTVQYSIGGNEI